MTLIGVCLPLIKVYFGKSPFYRVLFKAFPREGSSWWSFPNMGEPLSLRGVLGEVMGEPHSGKVFGGYEPFIN